MVLARDAIPSIDEPSFGTTYFGEDSDEVVVAAGDPARADPVRDPDIELPRGRYRRVHGRIRGRGTRKAEDRDGDDSERRDGQIHGDVTVRSAATGESADGRALASLAARRLFAVTWQDLHGPTAFRLN